MLIKKLLRMKPFFVGLFFVMGFVLSLGVIVYISQQMVSVKSVFAEELQDSQVISSINKWGYSSMEELVRAGDVYALWYCSSEKDTILPEEKNKYYLLSAKRGFPYVSGIWVSWGSDVFCTDEKGNTSLHLAATAQSIYLIEHLIGLGLNPNSRNLDNYAPIHICAQSGTAGVARTLISKGADPNLPLAMDKYSPPALIAGQNKNFEIVRILRAFDAQYSFSHAIGFGDIETVEAYLKENPEWAINGPTSYSTPPVIEAVVSNQKEVLLYLLEHGSSLDTSSIEGEKALSVAIKFNNKDMIRFLIDLGVNINGFGAASVNEYPLEYAIHIGNPDMVQYLLDLGADVNAVNVVHDSETPLHLAVKERKKEIAALLIERGANINARNKNGETPFFIAVGLGDREIAEYLIQQGADIEIVDRLRYTPLLVATEKGNEDMVKWLIEKGANVQARDKDGRTVLHISAAHGFVPLMETFLLKGVNIDEMDRSRNTSLLLAVEAKKTESVEFLVNRGADINLANSTGKTPLFVAVEVDSLSLAKYLVEHGAKTDVADREQRTLIHVGACSENVEMIHWLDGLGLDMFAVDKGGNSALHYACQCGALDTVLWLIDQKKLPLDELNKDGFAPLHLACQRGHVLIAKTLMELGADYKKPARTGQSAIHLCAARGHWGPAQILILKGVDPNLPDNSGNTPLHHAAMNAQERFVQLILAKRADICVRNRMGLTPLDLAKEQFEKAAPVVGATMSQIRLFEGLQGVIRLLTAVICEEYLQRIEKNDLDGFKKMIEFYPDFANVYYFGKTPIHRVIHKHSLEMSNLLIQLKVDIGVKELGIDGFTPLHLAVQEREINLVDLLLKSGADISLKDAKGRTPLELAESLNFQEISNYIKTFETKAQNNE